jgi:hypothetical protein
MLVYYSTPNSVKARRTGFGQEHRVTPSGIEMVRLAYNLGDCKDETEGLKVQVMESRNWVLGLEHPGTLTNVGNLALTYERYLRPHQPDPIELLLRALSNLICSAFTCARLSFSHFSTNLISA